MEKSNKQGENPQLFIHTISSTAFDEVRKLDNEELRTLLKEVKEMRKIDAPRYFKQSKKMKQLFKLEKPNSNTWSDQFYDVQRAIELEILWRVRTDAW